MIRALCLGSASSIWQDLEQASALFDAIGAEPDVVIGVNRFARDYPGSLDGWVTLHSEHMRRWVDERRAAGLPDHRSYWTQRNLNTYLTPGLNMQTVDPWGGSSGLLAVNVALNGFNADRVICCGIRLDRTAHFNVGQEADVPEQWKEAERYRARWRAVEKELDGRVKSVSGWTMEFLGAPDAGWLKG
jgi:hypothetical protein